MKQTPHIKKWRVQNGVLGYEDSGTFIAPSAEALFSAVHENVLNPPLTREDVEHLRTLYSFSKFPADLKIILQIGQRGNLQATIYAIPETGTPREIIPEAIDCDHTLVGSVWYPFVSGAMSEIMDSLRNVNLFTPGEISLGQYLSLTKNDTHIVQNEVESITGQFLETKLTGTPSGVNAKLYRYQKKGWQWLRFMKREQIGGILADEMGLGKTLQIIALLASEPNEDVFPSLIVSPTTLLENWRREIENFSPQISSSIHHGPQRTGYPGELRAFNVVITSYDTVIRDISLLKQINWRLVVCDEAQAIKNPSTRRSISIKQIPRESGFAVTGTPIENYLTDLWSIMDFAVPGFLGTLPEFESVYGSTDNGPEELEKAISPLILRRTVSEVARDLPPKIIIPQILQLSPHESESYERIRTGAMKEFESNTSLAILTRLRMFCTHPFLVIDDVTDPAEASNKYQRLIEIVEEIISNSSKVIVFTSYNRMNDIIVSDLHRRFGIYTRPIDGRTPSAHRQKVVDEFSAVYGPAALVLNPIAAGTGLNITAANHAIHYNLEWNPAKEDQASGRVHRRGQDKPVTIHRLFYANTVEEAIDERLTRKRKLANKTIVGVQGEQEDYDDILNALGKSPKGVA